MDIHSRQGITHAHRKTPWIARAKDYFGCGLMKEFEFGPAHQLAADVQTAGSFNGVPANADREARGPRSVDVGDFVAIGVEREHYAGEGFAANERNAHSAIVGEAEGGTTSG
jgi:hypothetical protein